MPRGALRAVVAVLVVGVVGAALVQSAEAATPLVPNQSIAAKSGWKKSGSKASWSFDRRASAIALRAKQNGVRTVVLTSSRKGATVRRGTTVSIAGEVAVSALRVPVAVQVIETDARSGRVLRSAIARRTTTRTGYEWYGADLTTVGAASRIQIRVTVRAAGRPVVRARGFVTQVGSVATPRFWTTSSPAASWVQHHADHPLAPAVRDRIALHNPSAWTLGEDVPYDQLRGWANTAQRYFRTAVVTPYYIPRRWDGLSDEQGAASLSAYQAFTDRVADGIGSTRAIVVLEPDALWFYAQVKRTIDTRGPYCLDDDPTRCYDQAGLDERLAALRYAVKRYTALERTTVYVEAGTSSGAVFPDEMAAALKAVGVGGAKVGFAVNVSSYSPEDAITDWATRIRTALAAIGVPNVRYVVDTGRNGNPDWTGHEPMSWCNPTGQKLGLPPGLATVEQRAEGRDYNLWVKGPGESDGDCGIGPGTVGGQFMPEAAESLLD